MNQEQFISMMEPAILPELYKIVAEIEGGDKRWVAKQEGRLLVLSRPRRVTRRCDREDRITLDNADFPVVWFDVHVEYRPGDRLSYPGEFAKRLFMRGFNSASQHGESPC